MLDIILGLSRQGVTIMMIEHIMRAIMRFSERVVCMDAGRVMAEGPPDRYRAGPRRAEDLPRCLDLRSMVSKPDTEP